MGCGCGTPKSDTPIFPITNGKKEETGDAKSPSLALMHKPGYTPAIRYIYRPIPILGAQRAISTKSIVQTAK